MHDTNWATGMVTAAGCPDSLFPGPTDAVDLANNPVTLGFGGATVASFMSNAPFTVFAGSLTVATSATYNGLLSINQSALGGGQHFINGGLNVSGNGLNVNAGATLNLASNTTLTASVGIQGGCTVINQAGRIVDAQADVTVGYLGGVALPSTFSNFGTFRKSGGTGITLIGNSPLAFNNSGLVDVQSGAVRFTSDGTHIGTFSVASGLAVEFSGGTHTLQNGTYFSTAAGLVRLNGALLTIPMGAAATIPHVEQTDGILGGAGTLEIPNSYVWSGGYMSGTGATNIGPNATLTINSNSLKIFGGGWTVNLVGSATWTGGTINMGGGGIVNILPQALFDAQFDGTVDGNGPGPKVFNNAGTFRKSAGSGNTSFSLGAVLNNNGLVDIQSGRLFLTGSATHTGPFQLAPGAAVEFAGGAQTLQSGTSFTGAGTAQISFGTVSIPSGVTVPVQHLAIVEQGGVLAGTGALNVSSLCEWSTGAMTDAGITRIQSGATLAMTTAFKYLLAGRTLENSGTANWSGGTVAGDGSPAAFNNLPGALFDITGNDSFQPLINNSGTLRKSGGSGTTNLLALTNTGTLECNSGTIALAGPQQFSQTASGQTVLNGGTLEGSFNLPVTFAGGTLRGNGPVHVHALNNTGASVAPGLSVGTLNITGNPAGDYTQGASGTLQIEIGGTTPGSGHDLLTAAGTATVGGTVIFQFVNGFIPQVGQTYTFLTASSVVGTFSTFNLPNVTGCLIYGPTSVGLMITSLSPAVTIPAASPPGTNPYGPGVFRDVLQNSTAALVPQGVGVAGTPAEGPYSYSTISVSFSSTPAPLPTTGNITRVCTDIAGNGQADCPTVTNVTGTGAGPYQLSLSAPPPPRECITFTFAGTQCGTRLQYQVLPGDTNLDGNVSTQDLLFLVQSINSGSANQAPNRARFNINRSNEAGGVVVNTQDLLRLVQLLNGVQATQVFNGATVAVCP